MPHSALLTRTVLLAAALAASGSTPALADGRPGTSPSYVSGQSFGAYLGPQSLTTSSYVWFLSAARQGRTDADQKSDDDDNTLTNIALAGGIGAGLLLGASELWDGEGSHETLQPEVPVVDIQTPPETTVTPEPISMTLLATGLAGMGGASFMRRRRRNEKNEE
jgi:hypothetical protein